jgi:hypothetical protein
MAIASGKETIFVNENLELYQTNLTQLKKYEPRLATLAAVALSYSSTASLKVGVGRPAALIRFASGQGAHA